MPRCGHPRSISGTGWFVVRPLLHYSVPPVFLLSLPGTESGFVGPEAYKILDPLSEKNVTLGIQSQVQSLGRGPGQVRRP